MRTTLNVLPALAVLFLATAAGAQTAGQTPGTAAPPDPAEAEQGRESGEEPQAVIRETDRAMSCTQIADEAALLSQKMGGDAGPGLIGALGGMARAGASMLIPGAGLVMAGADALTRGDRERDAAEGAAVQHRWFYLNGLHQGRACGQTVAATPAPAAPAPATSAPAAPDPAPLY